jgi:hypothetical protein
MDFDAFIEHQAGLLGLPIAPEHQPGVKRFVQLAAGMAELVMSMPLTPADESGTVFTPVAPEDLAP